jgi:hypothetical protein
MRRIERRVVSRAAAAGADIAERAVLLEDVGPVGEFVHRRLQGAGVLVSAGHDRYYVNQHAYTAFRRRRQRRAVLVVGVVVLVMALLFFRGDLS